VIERTGVLLLLVASAACAARVPPRPAGEASPDPGAITAFAAATKACAGLRTLTAELRLSGRAGGEKLGGTLHAGLAAPGSVRFEAIAPFGRPVFILAGRDNRATLLLTRDDRVLADAPVADLLERLTGLALTATDLRLILTGCLVEQPSAADGRSWANGWQAVSLGDGKTAYMRAVDGVTAVVAADHGQWRVDYRDHQGGWPRSVRIRSTDGTVDLTAAVGQLEINTEISDKAFVVDVPPSAVPMTLDHLRSVAPLRGSN
jgi:hypothetical protein